MCLVETTTGNKYDVDVPDTPFKPTWRFAYEENFDMVTAEGVAGKSKFGTIGDPGEFEGILRRTKLPVMDSENCQDWVWRVIREGVDKGLLKRDSLQRLENVPRLQM